MTRCSRNRKKKKNEARRIIKYYDEPNDELMIFRVDALAGRSITFITDKKKFEKNWNIFRVTVGACRGVVPCCWTVQDKFVCFARRRQQQIIVIKKRFWARLAEPVRLSFESCFYPCCFRFSRITGGNLEKPFERTAVRNNRCIFTYFVLVKSEEKIHRVLVKLIVSRLHSGHNNIILVVHSNKIFNFKNT